MKASELIKYLEEQIKIHRDICVCHSESHEYWGSVQSHLDPSYNINVSEHAQPDGPKKPSHKSIIIGY
jgi:hypothetical protein